MPSSPISATEGDSLIPPARRQMGLVTILFTDLVGSTQLKQDLGDREALALIQRHHALAREDE